MATTQYITLQRVKEQLPSSYNGTDDNALGDILLASCDFLDRFTNRSQGGFAVQTYDELYQGTGDVYLYLRNTPIVSITKIATAELPTIMIRNTDTDMGNRYSVQVNGTFNGSYYVSTGITLTAVQSAVTTTTTYLWANYPTVTSLNNVINTLGNGWVSLVTGGFGNWATTDIRALQGAFGNVRITPAYLWIHWWELPKYRTNELNGEIFSEFFFQRGSAQWRAVYQAGYQTAPPTGDDLNGFPNDLAQALAELTVATYMSRRQNANLVSETLGDRTYTQLTPKSLDGLSYVAKRTIQSYKKHPVQHFSSW